MRRREQHRVDQAGQQGAVADSTGAEEEAPPPSDPDSGSTSPLILDDPTIATDREPAGKGGGEGSRSDGGTFATGRSYTWQDGDENRTVTVRTDIAVARTADGRRVIIRTQGDAEGPSGPASGHPVFHSDTGEMMTLPGGVILVFAPGWTRSQIHRFLTDNDVDLSKVQPRTFTANAFFVETEPGFPSLTLANELASQDGVLISSPNWQVDVDLQ